MIVYCFNDGDTAGREMQAYVRRHGGQAEVVTHHQQIPGPECACLFAYMPEGREGEYVRAFIEAVTKQHGILSVPSNQAAQWHNRRVDQYINFGQWMPTAWLCRNDEDVQACVNDLPYPVRSVSNSGDVRRLDNPSEAFVEANEALHGAGIRLADKNMQQKYVFWQALLDKPSPAWRVIMFARKYAIAVMLGSGQVFPMDVMSGEIETLLQFVWAFMADTGLTFGSVTITPGLDPVRGVRGMWVDEYHANWPKLWGLQGGMIFETTDNGAAWKSTGIPAIRWYDVVAKAIVEGEFDG